MARLHWFSQTSSEVYTLKDKRCEQSRSSNFMRIGGNE